MQRLKTAVTILSIMLTWSLESAVETADSMKSRGYGLPGRTAFSIYRFDARDAAVICWLAACGIYIVSGWACGGVRWRYYPTMKGADMSPLNLSFLLVYLALCLTPLIFNMREDRRWRHTR